MGNKAEARRLLRQPIPFIAAAGLVAGLLARSDVVFLVTLIVGGVPLVFQTARGMLRGRFAADIVATEKEAEGQLEALVKRGAA